VEVRDDQRVRIFVNTGLPASTQDPETGFPCFNFARRETP
jgi:hypothetical protein